MKRILMVSLLLPIFAFAIEPREVAISLDRDGSSAKATLIITDEKEHSASFTILNSEDIAKILYTVTVSLLKIDDKNTTAKYSVERAGVLPDGRRNGILRNSYEQPIQMNETHVETLRFISDDFRAQLGLTVRHIPKGKAKL
jgi:hypothetical protein